MNYFTQIEKEELIVCGSTRANAIAIPSIKKAKYIISIEDKKVFFSGLNMLSSRSLKAVIAKIILGIIYSFGLTRIILKSNLTNINPNNLIISLIQQNYSEALGVNIYLGGAKSQNFSLTFQIVEHTKEYYLRYPMSPSSKKCALNEFNNIKYLQMKGIKSFVQQFNKMIPTHDSTLYAYEGIPDSYTTTILCKNKIKLLRELSINEFDLFTNNPFYYELSLTIKELLLSSTELLENKLIDIFAETIQSLGTVSMKKAFFHGDFSPDNILISGNRYFLIDFEYSCNNFFTCFDLFHYLYKANKFHLKIISLKDLTLIDFYVKKTYEKYPFFDNNNNRIDLLRYLYIFYLFFLLKRYLIDEKLEVKSDIIGKTATEYLYVIPGGQQLKRFGLNDS